MIIVTDVDGVLNNLMDAVLEVYNKKHKTSYVADDVITYNIANCFEPKVAQRIKDIFDSANIWNSVKPIEGAQDALQKLIRDGHQVYLATNNCPDTYGKKVAWIKHFFPFIEDSKIICIKDKWLLRCDIMIEDNVHALLAKPYYHRILMNHPWNQLPEIKDYGYDIYRCSKWDEIIEIVNKLKEKE